MTEIRMLEYLTLKELRKKVEKMIDENLEDLELEKREILIRIDKKIETLESDFMKEFS